MKLFGITIKVSKKRPSERKPVKKKHRKALPKQKILNKAKNPVKIEDDGLKIIKGKKAGYIESLDRLSRIERLIANGHSRPTIMQYCAENYHIKERQVDQYIAKIKDKWAEALEKDHVKNLALAINRRESLLERTVLAKDYRTSLSVMDSSAKLKSLFTEKIELSKGISDVPHEKLDELIKEAEKKEKKKHEEKKKK